MLRWILSLACLQSELMPKSSKMLRSRNNFFDDLTHCFDSQANPCRNGSLFHEIILTSNWLFPTISDHNESLVGRWLVRLVIVWVCLCRYALLMRQVLFLTNFFFDISFCTSSSTSTWRWCHWMGHAAQEGRSITPTFVTSWNFSVASQWSSTVTT